MAELTRSEQIAYEESAARTKKQAARDRGAADALKGAPAGAVDRARARALGQVEAPAAPRESAPIGAQKFVQVSERGKSYRVPDPQWYAMPPEQRDRYMDAVDADGAQKRDENTISTIAHGLLDQQELLTQRVVALEKRDAEKDALILQLLRQLEQQDTTLRIEKSNELIEAESQLAQTVVNAGAVKAQLETATANSARESEQQQADHRQRLEATERLVSDQEGRLKSSGTLFQERTVAIEQKLAAGESRQQRLDVQQQENANGIEANRNVLRAVTGVNFQSEIEMAVKRSFDQQLEPEMEKLIERRYVVTQPLTGSGGYDDKPEGYDEAFLAQQMGENAVEKAVNRALKKSKKR